MRDCPWRRGNEDYVHIAIVSYKNSHDSVGELVVSSLETKEK